MRRAAKLLAMTCLTGCAVQPSTSYVAGVSGGSDASLLAYGAANIIAVKTLGDGRPVALMPAVPAANPVSPALADVLRIRRIVLADPTQPGTHSVRYAVLPVEGAMIVMVTVDGASASQAFARGRGGWLVPAAPIFAELPMQDVAP